MIEKEWAKCKDFQKDFSILFIDHRRAMFHSPWKAIAAKMMAAVLCLWQRTLPLLCTIDCEEEISFSNFILLSILFKSYVMMSSRQIPNLSLYPESNLHYPEFKVVYWSQLVLARESWLLNFQEFWEPIIIILVAWNWSWWDYLYHGNWQMWKVPSPPSRLLNM